MFAPRAGPSVCWSRRSVYCWKASGSLTDSVLFAKALNARALALSILSVRYFQLTGGRWGDEGCPGAQCGARCKVHSSQWVSWSMQFFESASLDTVERVEGQKARERVRGLYNRLQKSADGAKGVESMAEPWGRQLAGPGESRRSESHRALEETSRTRFRKGGPFGVAVDGRHSWLW